jgi:hypothetical protein
MVANWEKVMFFVIRAGRKEIVQKLIKVREEFAKESDEQIAVPLSAHCCWKMTTRPGLCN